MTLQNRQYYRYPYQREYSTRIISSTAEGSEYHVVLANTIFYPEGGGQPADSGTINEIPILDVFETPDHRIVHVLPQDPGRGDALCKLDWPRRFYHMQHHTGQHLLSAVFFRVYSVQTAGFHLADDYATVDLDTASLSPELLKASELEVNKLVQQNLAVKSYFITAAECSEHSLLRKAPQVDSDIRIIEIDGFDAVPCCGTHVSHTGEVGMVKVIKTQRIRGLTRLYYRCGQEAFKDYQFKHDVITSLAVKFSSSDHDVLDRVNGELERKSELERELKKLRHKLLQVEAHQLAGRAAGRLVVHCLPADFGIDSAPVLINEILSLGCYLVLIAVENRLFLAHNLQDSDLDCAGFVKELAPLFDGRGGGKKDFAQVYFPSADKLEGFVSAVAAMLDKVKDS